jgi:hypothetical protein
MLLILLINFKLYPDAFQLGLILIQCKTWQRYLQVHTATCTSLVDASFSELINLKILYFILGLNHTKNEVINTY